MKRKLQITTIDLNGIRLEHNGSDSVSIHAEAPCSIAIDELIAELTSLRSQTSGAFPTYNRSSQSSHTLPVGSNHTTGLE